MMYGKYIEGAGFDVHGKLQHAQFYALLAYKMGGEESLRDARKHLEQAIARIDAALAEKDEAA